MKAIRIACRILVGMVFVFSGFVKLVDPLGSTYKFVDYFQAFHMGFMEPSALVLSVVMSLAEFLIGVALLIGLRMRITAWAVLIFMSFFTILTFFLALYNPVTDCGCFGDALVITNWQTFGKNVILMLLVVVIFISRKKYKPMFIPIGEWVAIASFAFFAILFTVRCYKHLPMLDFRPYKVGTNISESMMVPDSQKDNVDKYETTLIYKKNGVAKEFDLKHLPDSTWQWVETKNKLIKEGYHPPIHNFVISNSEGSEITDLVLADTGFAFYLITYNLEKASLQHVKEINDIAGWSQAHNITFKAITASSSKQIETFKKSSGASYEFYSADEVTLKTIIRSNPGLLLLRKGTVLAIWHHNDLPKVNTLKQDLLSTITGNYSKKIEREKKRALAVEFAFVILVVVFAGLYLNKRNN